MKMRDLIKEDIGGGDDNNSASPNQGSKGGQRGQMHPHHKSAIKGMTIYPEYPGYYYNMYRFGVNMAGNLHDDHDMAQTSNTANEMVTLAFSEADKEIIEKSMKNMGIKGKVMTGDESSEPRETNKTSPIAKRKPNKYGV
jgi:hypothetical protein